MEKTRAVAEDHADFDPEATSPEIPIPPDPALELKSERVQRELASLRGWQESDEAGGLALHLRFVRQELAYAFLAAVAQVAGELALSNPQLVLIGNAVGITLVHPDGAGISARQLRFARALTDHPARAAGRPLATEDSR
jgi:pterin-4a-carbinolamine dehydratase